MPDPAPGVYGSRIAVRPDGSVNTLWPERMPFFTHAMTGGNTYLLELLRDNRAALGIEASTSTAGFDTQIELTRELLQTATASLEITAMRVLDDRLEIDVRVTNRTGHKLPTGFPSRRMWIHLAVHDPNGAPVFESGAPDADGGIGTDTARLAPGCMAPAKPPAFDSSACYEPHRDRIDDPGQVAIYETVLADTNDDITHILLYANRYLKDNRLPPEGFTLARADAIEPQTRPVGTDGDADFNRDGGEGSGTDTVHYHIPHPGVEGRYRIDARLLFQTIQPAFVYGLSSDTDRVNDFKGLYTSSPPSVEALATASANLDVNLANGGGGNGGGGGCALQRSGGADPLLGLLLAALFCYRLQRRWQHGRNSG